MGAVWRDETDEKSGRTYRLHEDGRVAVYGPQFGSQGRWIVSAWTKDPRKHDNALDRYLCVDGTRRQMEEALEKWEAGK